MAIDKGSREARRKSQAEGAQRLIESGMFDDLFARIDAGEVQLDGDGGFIQQLIKTGLERGLQAELTEHVGYEEGDLEARLYDNSRNGSFPMTVATTAGRSNSPSRGIATAPSRRGWSRPGAGGCRSWMR